jgi:hypothetical protein
MTRCLTVGVLLALAFCPCPARASGVDHASEPIELSRSRVHLPPKHWTVLGNGYVAVETSPEVYAIYAIVPARGSGDVCKSTTAKEHNVCVVFVGSVIGIAALAFIAYATHGFAGVSIAGGVVGGATATQFGYWIGSAIGEELCPSPGAVGPPGGTPSCPGACAPEGEGCSCGGGAHEGGGE